MNGVLAVGLLARLLQPIDIFALVPEFQGIGRHRRKLQGFIDAVIKHGFQSQVRRQAVVMIGARKDKLVGFKVTVKNHLAGFRILDPHVFRHIALDTKNGADFRPDKILDPVHLI
jgi:hypothetical protein